MRLKIKKGLRNRIQKWIEGFSRPAALFSMAEMLSSPLCVLHMHVQRLQRVVHCLNNICFVPGGNGVLIINKKKGRKKKHRGGGTLAKRISRKKRKEQKGNF